MNKPRKRLVAALGECMIELSESPQTGLSSGFAGDTLNTATYLRRLLPEEQFDVSYLTAVGDDRLSARMLAAWDAEGISTDLVQRRPGELPGLYWIRTDEAGEREFSYWRSASAARQMLSNGHAQRIAGALQEDDLLYLSGISLAILSGTDREGLLHLLAELHERGVRIVYDCNFRRALWPIVDDARRAQRRVLDIADTFISSFADESAVFGDRDISVTAERIAATGISEWVVRGEPGETIASDAGRNLEPCLDPMQVVDTTGAGDSFDAAFLAARLCGHDMTAAIRAGHSLARVVVGHRGAIIDRDTTPELSRLVAA